MKNASVLETKVPVKKAKKSRRNVLLIPSVIIVLLLATTEIVLRVRYGFCDAVLYKTDPDFEYIAVPQKVRRFGNNVYYNKFSQRSPEITTTDSIIVLGFGDSVINGGTLVDNDSLATAKLSKYLSARYHKKIHVINISSQSWGPDNCYAYLKKYGDFSAKAMFLVLSSHDAYDDIDYQKVVGIDPSFPAKQYPLAILELFEKYLIPAAKYWASSATSKNGNGIDKRKPGSIFNTGINNLNQYAKNRHLPFLIYLHADQDELKSGKYSEEGQDIIKFCKDHQVHLVKELDYHVLNDKSYRDGIHLNSEGQEGLFEILKDKVYTSPQPK